MIRSLINFALGLFAPALKPLPVSEALSMADDGLYYPPLSLDDVDDRTGKPIREAVRRGHSICVVVHGEPIH